MRNPEGKIRLCSCPGLPELHTWLILRQQLVLGVFQRLTRRVALRNAIEATRHRLPKTGPGPVKPLENRLPDLLPQSAMTPRRTTGIRAG